MNIYLAGKIAADDWRHELVAGLYGAIDDGLDPVNRDKPHQGSRIGHDQNYRWPVLKKAIWRFHNYTGPFFLDGNHGVYQGENQHGVGAVGGEWVEDDTAQSDVWMPDEEAPVNPNTLDTLEPAPVFSEWLETDGATQEAVIRLCTAAIRQSDLVFAWVDDLTCYGTIAELGFARGIQERSPTWNPPTAGFVAGPPRPRIVVAGPQVFPDLWFVYQLADQSRFDMPDAATALRYAIGRPGEYRLDDPKRGTCRGCGLPVVNVLTANGKRVPIEDATLEERDGVLYAITHFAYCSAPRPRYPPRLGG